MKVILLKDMRGVGQKGDIKEVSEGYARNLLFPRGYAEAATPEKIEKLALARQMKEVERLAAEDVFNQKVASLRGKKITMVLRATEKGGLFKSITAPDIVRAIKDRYDVDLPASSVQLRTPIKTTGVHLFGLRGAEVAVEAQLEIVAS